MVMGAADQCTLSQVSISIPWHGEYWTIQLKAHLKSDSIKSSNTLAWPYQILVCMSLRKKNILISKNAAIMCGVYIINGVHGPEPRSSGGNTSSNPPVSALNRSPHWKNLKVLKICKKRLSVHTQKSITMARNQALTPPFRSLSHVHYTFSMSLRLLKTYFIQWEPRKNASYTVAPL